MTLNSLHLESYREDAGREWNLYASASNLCLEFQVAHKTYRTMIGDKVLYQGPSSIQACAAFNESYGDTILQKKDLGKKYSNPY